MAEALRQAQLNAAPHRARKRDVELGNMKMRAKFRKESANLEAGIRKKCQGLHNEIKWGKLKVLMEEADARLASKANSKSGMESRVQKAAKKYYVKNPEAFIENAKEEAKGILEEEERGLFEESDEIHRKLRKSKIVSALLGAFSAAAAASSYVMIDYGAKVAVLAGQEGTQRAIHAPSIFAAYVLAGATAVLGVLGIIKFMHAYKAPLGRIREMQNGLEGRIDGCKGKIIDSIKKEEKNLAQRL